MQVAADEALTSSTDCAQLRRWYVRATLPLVGPWGLGGPSLWARRLQGSEVVPVAGGRSGSGRAADPGAGSGTGRGPGVGSSPTGTTVQEPGVDEPDVAKTDGRVVVRLVGGELVVTDVTGDAPREVSRTRLPGPALAHPELLLADGRAYVVGTERAPLVRPGAAPPDRRSWRYGPRPSGPPCSPPRSWPAAAC